MDIGAFRDVFAAEARDYLQSLNTDLLKFEQDPNNRAILDDLFRAAHSLKGMAGTMGFDELAEFTHEMESVLDLLRNGELSPHGEVINVLFSSVDTLELLLEKTINDLPIGSMREEIAALEALCAGEHSPRQEQDKSPQIGQIVLDEFNRETIKQGIEQGYAALQIIVTLRPRTILKSVRVYTVFQALEEVATIIQSEPSVQDLENENFGVQFGLILLTRQSVGRIKRIVEGISEIEKVEISAVDLDRKLKSFSVSVKEMEKETAVSGAANAGRSLRAETLVRVETERLDKLINLVGELVISRAQVVELVDVKDNSHQKNAVLQLDRITTQLQYAAMSLRMVPLKQVFDRFPRMVRDLAQSSNKKIELKIAGEMTELDRSIVNKIGDPLVHLIRNSIDHGLEAPGERIARGKPETGTISLEARHEGSHILIEIRDDGQGLHVDKIREKAVQRGLLPPDGNQITNREAVELLFSPGFSTAEQVSDLSGRGVGLDAVRSTVESLSGTIDIHFEPGQSLTTTIKLPLTLAIIKALMVIVDGDHLAIPLQAVRENIQVEQHQIKTVQQRNVIMLRDQVLPLYDLAECLGFNGVETNDPFAVIILDIKDEKVGFIVEDLIGQQEIVIKSLNGVMREIPGIAGATVLGNGNVALILDNSTLLDRR